MNSSFFWNSIPNILVIAFLFFYLFQRKNVGSVLVAFFTYISLHGGYAVYAAATADGINTMNKLHYIESDLGVKVIGFTFLLCCLVLLVARIKQPWILIKESIFFKLDSILAFVFYITCMILGAINSPDIKIESSPSILKELFFSIFMWVGAIAFSIAINKGHAYFYVFRKECLLILATLVTIMIAVGTFEIISGIVWAGTAYIDGFSYRASGTLFNPNVLGYWGAMMALIASFIYHFGLITRWTCFIAMIFIFTCILLSSSRTGLILAVINLSAVSVIIFMNNKDKKIQVIDKVWPLLAFHLAFILYVIFFKCINQGNFILDTLRINLSRFVDFPSALFSVLISKMGYFLVLIFPETKYESWQLQLNGVVLTKFKESLNGRILINQSSDNSFAYIYSIGGLAALFAWSWLWVKMFLIGFKKNIENPNIYSAYALAGLSFCFFSGFFLRTPQLFPLFIFNSILLGCCFNWWSSVSNYIEGVRK